MMRTDTFRDEWPTIDEQPAPREYLVTPAELGIQVPTPAPQPSRPRHSRIALVGLLALALGPTR